MNLSKLFSLASLTALVSMATLSLSAQEAAPPATGAGPKIAVMNIDRIAMESESGKKMFERLKVENDRIQAEQVQRAQEIRDLTTKQNSEILSAEARARLQRDIEKKQRDAQRWLEDQQGEFQEKQQAEEAQFQEMLAPIVQKVAKDNGIGLIIRETPGLTYLLDPSFDITALVVEALNAAESAGASGANP